MDIAYHLSSYRSNTRLYDSAYPYPLSYLQVGMPAFGVKLLFPTVISLCPGPVNQQITFQQASVKHVFFFLHIFKHIFFYLFDIYDYYPLQYIFPLALPRLERTVLPTTVGVK